MSSPHSPARNRPQLECPAAPANASPGHRQRAERAGSNVFEGRGHDVETDLHSAGQQIGDRLPPAAAIWHVNDVDAGHHLEQLAREKKRARGWRTEVQLSRVGFGICDELRDRFDGERRSYRNQIRDADNARDRRNIADEIEIELVEKCRTDRVRIAP